MPRKILLLLFIIISTCYGQNEDEDRNGKKDASTASTTLIADMARELITQSYSNSQVLSLNLSNVLILLLLKGVLLAIGHYGLNGLFDGGKSHENNNHYNHKPWSGPGPHGGPTGFWSRSGPDSKPRDLPEENKELPVTEGELLMALGYLNGERQGDYSCLYRAACLDSQGRAPEYLTAGKILMKAANVLSSVVTLNPKYNTIVAGLEDAILTDKRKCSIKYKCKT